MINNVFVVLVFWCMVICVWIFFFFWSFSIVKEDLLNILNELGLENFMIEVVENCFFCVWVGVIVFFFWDLKLFDCILLFVCVKDGVDEYFGLFIEILKSFFLLYLVWILLFEVDRLFDWLNLFLFFVLK